MLAPCLTVPFFLSLDSQAANTMTEEQHFFDQKIAPEAATLAAAGAVVASSEHVSDATRLLCSDLLLKFGKEVLLQARQYKDELLVACYFFVLSLPTAIVARDPGTFFPAVRGALRIGIRSVCGENGKPEPKLTRAINSVCLEHQCSTSVQQAVQVT